MKAYHVAIDTIALEERKLFIEQRALSSNAEIAMKMNISVKTVENQMTSAMAKTRKTLRSLGFSAIIFLNCFYRLKRLKLNRGFVSIGGIPV